MITFSLLSLILISIWAGFYQLVKQQGRILLRLDALEEAAKRLDARESKDPATFPELPLETAFPAFELPDLSGKKVALKDFLGTRVLVIQWDFGCGFCESIVPHLTLMHASFNQNKIRIVLLAQGDKNFNREHAKQHGLECPILILHGQSPKPFQGQGTPVAYLLDERGCVAAPFANGADETLALVLRIASSEQKLSEGTTKRHKLAGERPLSESRLQRNGLKEGTPAPTFKLPDLHAGRMVSLEDYRGRRVLLVFTDPQCGPCDELAPHLTRLDQQHRSNGLSIVLVGRGDVEENRRKAEQYKFRFPVLVQEKWKLSKEYGIFATPVAFLIQEDGVISKNVAIGKDAILALARDGRGEPEE